MAITLYTHSVQEAFATVADQLEYLAEHYQHGPHKGRLGEVLAEARELVLVAEALAADQGHQP